MACEILELLGGGGNGTYTISRINNLISDDESRENLETVARFLL
jgi:hypothetical protein